MARNLFFLLFIFFTANCIMGQGVKSLSGVWRFALDSDGKGVSQEWWNRTLTDSITLPGSTDMAQKGSLYPVERHKFNSKIYSQYPDSADFGNFTRIHKYIGKAWYQRDFVIDKKEASNSFNLFLERVLWQSNVWIDGVKIDDTQEFLTAPHKYKLGKLKPGRHTITIMIDNSEIYPISPYGHSYCTAMQTLWNGIVGRIELQGVKNLEIKDVQVYPSFENKKIVVKSVIDKVDGKPRTITVKYAIKERENGKLIKEVKRRVKSELLPLELADEVLFDKVEGWDEFDPNLYILELTVSSDGDVIKAERTFGFRDFSHQDKLFTVNGRKLFLRNTHEGMFFGKTGFPATDKEYWMRVFGLYKSFGINSVRFHSSTPPKAAFEAADELGLYLQVEFFWIDGWFTQTGLIGKENARLNEFVKLEVSNALKEYGNHPSMVLVGIGNELGGNFDLMGEWIAEWKSNDSRHLYAAGMAHDVTLHDDFVEYGGKHESLKVVGTDWNYTKNYTEAKYHAFDREEFRRKNLPEFTHEMGQFVVHPLWSEGEKYDGVLRAYNYDYFRSRARENGIENMDYVFQKASGQINKIFNKAEIEASLRTPECAGYSLLSMVDYAGQGEALIGWVDAMYEVKNFITADEYRQYGSAVVPLLKFDKYVWVSGETFEAKAIISNFGKHTFEDTRFGYSVMSDCAEIARGEFPLSVIPHGALFDLGSLSVPLITTKEKGEKLTVNLFSQDGSVFNSWDIWVFPKNDNVANYGVNIVSTIEEALSLLGKGEKVILEASSLGNNRTKKLARFDPVFWSSSWFTGQQTEVCGAVVRNNHPALSKFETGDIMDWQWADVCQGSRGFILSDLPKGYNAIVQPVHDYHFGSKLGSIFELKTKDGGKLLVCGYNLSDNLHLRPSTRQLRESLISYVASSQFLPSQLVEERWLLETFVNENLPTVKPKAFAEALVYVECGAKHKDEGSSVSWEKQMDGVIVEPGFQLSKVMCSGIWRDETGGYWFGQEMEVRIAIESPDLYTVALLIGDPNNSRRKAEIQCEDLPLVVVEDCVPEKWIKIETSRENCLDGEIVIKIKSTSGPNAMIKSVVLNKR